MMYIYIRYIYIIYIYIYSNIQYTIYYLHFQEKGNCSDNSQCHGNTLLIEILSFYYHTISRKFSTPLHSEPGMPLKFLHVYQLLPLLILLLQQELGKQQLHFISLNLYQQLHLKGSKTHLYTQEENIFLNIHFSKHTKPTKKVSIIYLLLVVFSLNRMIQ